MTMPSRSVTQPQTRPATILRTVMIAGPASNPGGVTRNAPARESGVEQDGNAWKTPNDIKNVHKNASILRNNRVAFNIKGNDYRIVVLIHYQKGLVFLRFVGTHQEYDRIDATTI
jgi:mRNA interferase HigB